ncbi:hypothetical protein PISMIDRAFT_25618 [Pisolithus microcarpus 441]|uniref:Uncharacterized protein n=1 Tax=Pisolithus microcarpus 441 TaxID=765257 RepID=A0A0C9YG13_9AGAM|nr:hypothetical protein PISMIDRAFT_25618 [Pisolithus microcarpus 441]
MYTLSAHLIGSHRRSGLHNRYDSPFEGQPVGVVTSSLGGGFLIGAVILIFIGRLVHQKEGCRLPSETVQGKRKDSRLSHRVGEKRKRAKVIGEDHDTRFVGTSTAIARPSAGAASTSAGAAPDLVAEVLDRRLGEITSLLRDLIGKVDEVANVDGKVTLPERDELAEDGGDDDADGDGDDDTDLGGSIAN